MMRHTPVAPGAHTRRPNRRPPNTTHLTVAVCLVVALAGAWTVRSELGFGSGRVASADTAAETITETDHSGHTGTETGTPVDASAAPNAGPVSDLDKQLLVAVRQANLWELPAGRLAQQNGSLEQVKRAGLHLMEGHSRLDQMVREIAQALGVTIPDQPTADQQKWLTTLRTSRGAEFDRFFANQLRDSHGKVFVMIAQVRATTQNSIVRDLAIEANKQVADHMEVLEDTGLVEPRTLENVAEKVVT